MSFAAPETQVLKAEHCRLDEKRQFSDVVSSVGRRQMDESRVKLSQGLADVLGVANGDDVAAVASGLARVADLPSPNRAATQRVLVEIVLAFQRSVIDEPEMPMDRAYAADTALSRGCMAAGPEVTRELFDELGTDALDKSVRNALASTIASALIGRGEIRLVGG